MNMNIFDIIAALYFGIGCISAAVALVELSSIGKGLSKGLPFTFLGIMYFGNLILWPLFIPMSIKQYREIQKHIALEKKIGKTIENLKGEHDEQLAAFIDGLSKRYPEVSFAKLTRIAVAVSRWEEKRIAKFVEEERKRGERYVDVSFWRGWSECAWYLLKYIKPPKR